MERETGYEVERELAAGGAVRIAGVDEVFCALHVSEQCRVGVSEG
jgi:hypothetical protein